MRIASRRISCARCAVVGGVINREFAAGGHAVTGEEYALNVTRVAGAASRLAEGRGAM